MMLLLPFLLPPSGFHGSSSHRAGALRAQPHASPLRAAIPAFLPKSKVDELSEQACLQTLAAIETQEVELPSTLASGPVTATFARTNCAPTPGVPPVVLLHGFDSSCLEFRRLLPELEARGIEAYALDIFGWGFADTTNANSVGVDAKREHLLAFQKAVLDGRQMLLSGVSLGWAAASHLPAPAAHPVPDLAVCSPTRIPWPCSAAIIIDFYAAHPEAVAATVLVDPQGFLDGTPPVPERFARAGIQVLGSWPLRSMANQMAYYDTDTLATDDAIRVGQLHCLRPG